MSNAIEIKNLRKEYKSKLAVNNISFDIEEGTLFGLLGVNGAGKTTTIKMLTGLTKPSAGDAIVCGYSVNSQIDKIKEVVNLSTQESAVAPKLTVKENLEFMAGVYGVENPKQRVETILKDMGLESVAGMRAKTLSGGWTRRLSIAMALITEPKVLFLDEPTLGLDVLARRELWNVIEKLKGKMTIILTTHYMEEAESLADRIAVMVDGSVKALGSVEELKKATGADSLENAFVKIATE